MPAVLRSGMIRADFSHSVDVPILLGGDTSQIEALFAWCEAVFTIGSWSIAGHGDLGTSDPPRHSIRFYFRNASDAAAFRHRWEIA
jgi:hypothetical protein